MESSVVYSIDRPLNDDQTQNPKPLPKPTQGAIMKEEKTQAKTEELSTARRTSEENWKEIKDRQMKHEEEQRIRAANEKACEQ